MIAEEQTNEAARMRRAFHVEERIVKRYTFSLNSKYDSKNLYLLPPTKSLALRRNTTCICCCCCCFCCCCLFLPVFVYPPSSLSLGYIKSTLISSCLPVTVPTSPRQRRLLRRRRPAVVTNWPFKQTFYGKNNPKSMENCLP